jgi:hypothetical protein
MRTGEVDSKPFPFVSGVDVVCHRYKYKVDISDEHPYRNVNHTRTAAHSPPHPFHAGRGLSQLGLGTGCRPSHHYWLGLQHSWRLPLQAQFSSTFHFLCFDDMVLTCSPWATHRHGAQWMVLLSLLPQTRDAVSCPRMADAAGQWGATSPPSSPGYNHGAPGPVVRH